MLGAIAGDMIGSVYEARNIHTTEFPLFRADSRFTDDTALTVALADSILHDTPYVDLLKAYYFRYPRCGFGGAFHDWAQGPSSDPYNSWGNGSAMRVSPVAWAWDSLEDVLREAEASAAVTHSHPEGIKGAQAIAACVYLARSYHAKETLREFVEARFRYDLSFSLDAMRSTYTFDVSCAGSVPQAIVAFIESEDFEDAIRKAISIGGDSDTIASMAGAIAEAFYGGVPAPIATEVWARLDAPLRDVTEKFRTRYGCPDLR